MLAALAALLACQLAGEAIVRAASLPVPGPVAGMALLFVLMAARAPLPKALGDTADGMLKHLSLLFVPAGVGVMLHFKRLGAEWLPIAVALVASTVITIAVAALVMKWLRR